MDAATHELLYLGIAWHTGGESIRQHPVRPGCFSRSNRALYRAMVDCERWGASSLDRTRCLYEHADALSAAREAFLWAPGAIDAWMQLSTIARELELAYVRRKRIETLLAEAEAVRAGAYDDEEAA